MGRIQHCSKSSNGALNRRHWTPEEDMVLKKYIEANGVGGWSTLPQKAGLTRCGKSCRLRWMNHLRPNVKGGHISPEEEELIIRLHTLLGNRWSLIAGRVPGRTDNDVKNYWNVHLSKKLTSKNRRKFVKEPSLNFVDNHKYINSSDAAPRINSVHHKHKVDSKSRCIDPTPQATFEPTHLRNSGVMPSDLDHSCHSALSRFQPQPPSLPVDTEKDHQMVVPVCGPATGESGEVRIAPSVNEVNGYGIVDDMTACTVQTGDFDPSFDNFRQVEKCWDTLQSFSPCSWFESLPWFGYSTEQEIQENSRFEWADNVI